MISNSIAQPSSPSPQLIDTIADSRSATSSSSTSRSTLTTDLQSISNLRPGWVEGRQSRATASAESSSLILEEQGSVSWAEPEGSCLVHRGAQGAGSSISGESENSSTQIVAVDGLGRVEINALQPPGPEGMFERSEKGSVAYGEALNRLSESVRASASRLDPSAAMFERSERGSVAYNEALNGLSESIRANALQLDRSAGMFERSERGSVAYNKALNRLSESIRANALQLELNRRSDVGWKEPDRIEMVDSSRGV